jgi:hypothetical protein
MGRSETYPIIVHIRNTGLVKKGDIYNEDGVRMQVTSILSVRGHVGYSEVTCRVKELAEVTGEDLDD